MGSSLPWPLAAAETMLPGNSLHERSENATAFGYQGVELYASGLNLLGRMPELRSSVAHGVHISSICQMGDAYIGSLDSDRRQRASDELKAIMDIAAELEAPAVLTALNFGETSTVLPPFHRPRSRWQDRQVLHAALSPLGEYASRRGVRLLLEPVNRYEDSMFHTISDVARLVEEIGIESLGVLADTFQMNIEEHSMFDAIVSNIEVIGHVQLADTNRLEPGAGHMDWATVLGALENAHYSGWLSLECELSKGSEPSLRRARETLSLAIDVKA